MSQEYDLITAYKRIETELLKSMKRNLNRHIKEEEAVGKAYEMWQAEQLQELQIWLNKELPKYSKDFLKANELIQPLLLQTFKDSRLAQESDILKAIENGWKGQKVGEASRKLSRSINTRKLNSLISSTKSEILSAQMAILRKTEDIYRQTIYNSQIYLQTGSGTLANAVDMASQDFMQKGINAIMYKNGALVNISTYTEMALRTANTRAYLQGEASMRDEWGINTVIINSRGSTCPLCDKWIGKVMVDDVYSAGAIENTSGYPLLSEAMAGGLYHPNCKDTHSTFFPGITNIAKHMNKEEKKKAIEEYNNEQGARRANARAAAYKREATVAADPANKRIYNQKAKYERDKADSYRA